MSLLREFLRLFGYSIAANLLTPVPSDAVAVTLGYVANLYGAPLPLAIAAGAVSILFMDTIYYSFFRFFGGRLGLVEKIIKKRTVESFRERMIRHMGKTVLFLRFWPGPGILSPILAGVLKIPLLKYLAYDLVGIVIANAIFVTLGDLFHSSIETLLQGIGREKHIVSIAFIVIVSLAISWRIYKKYVEKITLHRLRQIYLLLLHEKEGGVPAGKEKIRE